jgi:hypothetical protein
MQVKVTGPSASTVFQSVSSSHEPAPIPWAPVRSVLEDNFSFGTIKNIIASAGLDIARISHVRPLDGKGDLMTAIDVLSGQLADDKKSRFVAAVIEELISRKPDIGERLDGVLRRVEWSIVEGRPLPIKLLDQRELEEVPKESRDDLLKAAKRFQDGDLSGALSAACRAVDSITAKIYAEKNIGDPGPAAFQEKIARSLEATEIINEIESDLVQLGWEPEKAKQLAQNLRGSLNQASFVMQTLRSKMGDVHGTKATIKALVFDSLQWSKLILRMFTDRS